MAAHRQGPPQSQRSLAKQTDLSLGYVNQTLQRLRALDFLSEEAALTPAGRQALEPYRVTNAIILAAGMSIRCDPVSYEQPKGLLIVKDEVLIEREIRQLHEAGIDDITVVVGYRQEQFYYLEDEFGVRIVVSPEYRERNNNASLKAAEEWLDNTYICNSDDYFTENVFEPYVYQGYCAAVWKDGPTHEWSLIAAPSGRITSVVRGGSDTWAMMGHAYWDRSCSMRFRSIIDSVYDHPDTAPKSWKELFADRVTELNLQLRPYPEGVIWEFDTLDDLRAFDEGFISNIDTSILDNICATLQCQCGELTDFTPMTGGMTNLSFRFNCKGVAYVYRHPGLATRGMLDRAAEAQAEAIATELGLDETFVWLDPTTGWKITRYWDACESFDYHNPRHVQLALASIRKLHTQPRTIDRSFDLLAEARALTQSVSGGDAVAAGRFCFSEFRKLRDRAHRLHALSQMDGSTRALCHNDFYAPNILIDGDRQALIDWEYTGMGDPASDLGTFICCSDYSWDEVLGVLEIYFGRPPTRAELRHYTAYISLAAYYWWVWALFKDVRGQDVGAWTHRWYRYAKDFGVKALALYEADGLGSRVSVMADEPAGHERGMSGYGV